MINQLEQMFTAYDVWLDRQPWAANTRSAYRTMCRYSLPSLEDRERAMKGVRVDS
jgi:hypothetical protein